ncbi:MAG: proline--tRNA ligase, partial [Vicinamibacteria bacterium]|nr:proline--tRNA ligase [Vicinamibacteria bacterium]
QKETLDILEMYREVAEDVLAMPVYFGPKSDSEKFAGAARTYAIEALMGDGKALQAGTSHNLGQHFAKAYEIEFVDQNQQRALPWSTSWGVSTRLIGGLIMTHGDDRGLVIPPKVAPYQVVIVPIPPRKGDWNEAVLPKARAVASELTAAGIRVHLDDRDNHQTGFKYADWEMRGVPIRMELGPKDIEKDSCVLVRRDTKGKEFVPLAGLAASVLARLDAIQKNLLENARKFRDDNTSEPVDYDGFKEVMSTKRGFLLAGVCSSAECEAKIKEETRATVRCFPLKRDEDRACIRCGTEGKLAYFAQAY